MPRYFVARPTRDEFLEALTRHYGAVDKELRGRGLKPLLPDEVEWAQTTDTCYDPLKRYLPEEEWVACPAPEEQEGAMVVDALVQVAGIFDPWQLIYRKELPTVEGEARSILPMPEE